MSRLSVKPLKQKDSGRGLAAIDRQVIEELGLEGGDYVQIDGSGGTAIARVWPGYPEDTGESVIRIDGELRQQADVGSDDTVEIEVADIEPAKSVAIALPQNLHIKGNIGGHLRDKLAGQPVTKGKSIDMSLDVGAPTLSTLKVVSTDPGNTVIVTDSTEVTISQKSVERIEGRSNEVSIESELVELLNHGLYRGDAIKIKGKLKNICEETIPKLEIWVWFYADKDATQHLESKFITTRKLKPGNSWSFEVPFGYPVREDQPESYDITVKSR